MSRLDPEAVDDVLAEVPMPVDFTDTAALTEGPSPDDFVEAAIARQGGPRRLRDSLPRFDFKLVWGCS